MKYKGVTTATPFANHKTQAMAHSLSVGHVAVNKPSTSFLAKTPLPYPSLRFQLCLK